MSKEVKEMAYDGIVTKAITEELQEQLIPGRINKIYQPSDTELLITIRANRKNHTLLLSIHPSYARLHLTDDKFQNPEQPPMFCMLLRKHLSGAIIESIEQDDLERIGSFSCRTRDEIGDETFSTVVIELMGRHSNIILLNENKTKIIDCIKHVPAFQNRYRTLLPGADYKKPPSQNKMNILKIDSTEFIKRLDFNAGKLDRQIVQILTGFSPMLAKELVHRTELGGEKAYRKQFDKMKSDIKNKNYEPAIYRGNREDFHIIKMTSIKEQTEIFNSVNKMLDTFYSGKAERDRVKQRARDLYRVIKNEQDKNIRKLKIHEKTLSSSKRADEYQKLGELLTANMHLVKQGDSSIKVIDYYDPDQSEITINLQTDQTPSENAQRYFTRYRKLANSRKVVRREIIKTKREIAYLDNILQHVESAREEDIEEIREELREQGYLRRQKQGRRSRKKPQPEHFTSSDGVTILVGRNNRQNEYVTHRLAHRNDIWLHTLDIPGSHVVIRHNNPSEQTLIEAAQIAAYYSKAHQSSSVPVDYTLIRHVKKPSGAKPGFVTYDNQKTLFVTPDEELVEKLKAK